VDKPKAAPEVCISAPVVSEYLIPSGCELVRTVRILDTSRSDLVLVEKTAQPVAPAHIDRRKGSSTSTVRLCPRRRLRSLGETQVSGSYCRGIGTTCAGAFERLLKLLLSDQLVALDVPLADVLVAIHYAGSVATVDKLPLGTVVGASVGSVSARAPSTGCGSPT
jgi:hypothetical protein